MYLLGSSRTHTHTHSPPAKLSFHTFSAPARAGIPWVPVTVSSVWCPWARHYPSSLSGGSRVWWLYRHLPLSVCFAEKLNTVLKHTHTYETTRRGLSCQILLLLSPASSKQVPLFRWCCCLLTICAQFWDSQSQECWTGLAKNLAELVPVCALGNRACCLWLWAAPVQQRGGEGHNPAGKGHCWEPKELKSHWWHASYKN